MKIKLFGLLLLAAALFVFTRGEWNFGYMLAGVALAFPAALLLTPLRSRPILNLKRRKIKTTLA